MTNYWEEKIDLSYLQKILLGQTESLIPFLLDKHHPRKKEVFDNYLKFGVYPAISDSSISDKEKQDWLKNYVRTYLERDIRDLAEMRQLEPFTKVQKLLAINTAHF